MEYKKRRDKILAKLRDNSVAIIFSSLAKTRSNDTTYPYRQSSNFYYLCGFSEDNSALVFTKSANEAKCYMFVQKKEPLLELWDGKRVGVQKAKELFDVDDVFEYDELKIISYTTGKNAIYCEFDFADKRVLEILGKSQNAYELKNFSKLIEKDRLIKSKSELKLVRKAIKITAKAHVAAMKMKKSSKYEYELQAKMEYVFKKNGAFSDAYGSIVASGNNANTLHYIKNSKKMKKGELLLIDAGCEYKYYASDITRTIPVSGAFSKAQKDIYSLVLSSQLQALKMIKPDVLRSEIQQKVERTLARGLKKLGFFKGSLKEILKQKKHKKYFPHGIGHWMGLDVHDMAPYKNKKNQELPLKKGMVLTIEPALYIDEDDKDAPKKYRGIGIRIEDDVLVTKSGYKNLSKAIPKSIKEIERLSK